MNNIKLLQEYKSNIILLNKTVEQKEIELKFNEYKQHLIANYIPNGKEFNKDVLFPLIVEEIKCMGINHTEKYNTFMNWLKNTNVINNDLSRSILIDTFPKQKFIQITTLNKLLNMYNRRLLTPELIISQNIKKYPNDVPFLLTSEQKYKLMLNGRTTKYIKKDVLIHYNDIENMLKVEKYILNKYKFNFNAKQIENIFTDPLNLVLELATIKIEVEYYFWDNIEGKDNLNENYIVDLLLKYDPDAYYNGKTFVELVNIIGDVFEDNNNDKYYNMQVYFNDNIFNEEEVYKKYEDFPLHYKLLVGNTFKSRGIYGVFKVLFANNLIDDQHLYMIFNIVKEYIDSKYVYKLFRYMLDTELKRFNINTNTIIVGKGTILPYALFKVKDDDKKNVRKDIEVYNNKLELKNTMFKDLTSKLTVLYKLKEDILDSKYNQANTEILLNIDNENFSTFSSKYIQYIKEKSELKTKAEKLELYNTVGKLAIDNVLYNIDERIDYIVTVNDSDIYDFNINYNTSTLLIMFIKHNDYNSVKALLDIGINPNSYYIVNDDIREFEDNITILPSILYINTFKMLKFMYNNGADINVFDKYSNNIYFEVLNFKQDSIAAILWLLNKHIIPVISPKYERYNNFLKIIQNGYTAGILHNTQYLIPVMEDIVKSYLK